MFMRKNEQSYSKKQDSDYIRGYPLHCKGEARALSHKVKYLVFI